VALDKSLADRSSALSSRVIGGWPRKQQQQQQQARRA
jgi:hypothetical protein